jgi:glutaredoxin
VFDKITFQAVPGNDTSRHIRLLALSTCGFCRRGQDFLESRSLAYEYAHLDTLDPEVKAEAKQEFKDRFGVTLSYPTLIVDDTGHTVGYVKRQWEDLLGIFHDDEAVDAEAID